MNGKINKGHRTEEMVRLYFYKSGFYALRGVKIKYDGIDLTDVDIWVYERSATLSRRRLIIDVKDKKVPQAAERLMFVVGLADVIGVESAGVATTESRPALRDLAKKKGIIWIDNDDLKRIKNSEPLLSLERISEEALYEKVSNHHQPIGEPP